MRLLQTVVFAFLLGLAGCASMGPQTTPLEKRQYAWAGGNRWGPAAVDLT